MESLLWLRPPPSPAPLSSALRSEQKPSVPSQNPVSPRHQPVSSSPVSAHSLKIVPSHLPGGACSRGHASCLQGLTGAPWCLLSAVSLSLRGELLVEKRSQALQSSCELRCPFPCELGLLRGQERFAGSRGPGRGLCPGPALCLPSPPSLPSGPPPPSPSVFLFPELC